MKYMDTWWEEQKSAYSPPASRRQLKVACHAVQPRDLKHCPGHVSQTLMALDFPTASGVPVVVVELLNEVWVAVVGIGLLVMCLTPRLTPC
jgi:hypothetical protein